MAKGREKKAKREKITRRQRRAMDKNFFGGPENLDSQLKSLGLCTKSITGDGNCLFRSLSDQYHGQDGNHKAVRQEICQYLRDNEETYKFFVEDDQSFEHHVECMSQDATFGGNMELVAFAKLKKVDIKVYQPGMIYVINGVDDENENEQAEDDDEQRQILHIAYHSWEHYSSVRNINGPYSGPPEIKVIEQALSEGNDTNKSKVESDDDGEEELNSKEKVVRSAHPNESIRKIRRLLIKYKGNPDKVIDAIYELEHKLVEAELEKEIIAEIVAEAVPETAALTNQAELDASTEKKDDTRVNSTANEEDAIMSEEEAVEKAIPMDIVDKELPQQQEPDQPPPSSTQVGKKPKKLSAAERKKEQKKRQKENKIMKDRAKAARKAGYKQAKPQNEDDSDSTHVSAAAAAATQSMKEMYI